MDIETYLKYGYTTFIDVTSINFDIWSIRSTNNVVSDEAKLPVQPIKLLSGVEFTFIE